MPDEVTREIVLDADPATVWQAITDPDQMDGWLGEEVELDLVPGGDLRMVDPVEGELTGWVEVAQPHRRLAVWWQAEGDDEARRVQFDIDEREDGTGLTVVETRPLVDIDREAAALCQRHGPTALALA